MPSPASRRAGALARTRYTSAITQSRAKRSLRAAIRRRLPLRTFKRKTGFRLNTHRFTRYAATQTITVARATAGQGGCYKFQFNELVNSSEFSNLFDRYMITGVLVKFQLINNPNSDIYPNVTPAANATSSFYPKIWLHTDYDDDSTPTKDDLKQVVGVKEFVLRPNTEVKYFVKPAILAQTYRTAVTTGYAPKWKTWIDMANLDVPHYGLKYFVDCPDTLVNTSTSEMKVRVELKYYFTCKDVR